MAHAEEAEPPAPNPSRRRALSIGFGVLAVPVIGAASYQSIRTAAGGSNVRANLTLIAPAAAGGGWDAFQREMQQTMRTNGLVGNVQVLNIPGAGGTIAIGSLSQQNEANNLMVGGTGQIAAQIQFDTASVVSDVTPVARVVEEYALVTVPADSPHQDLDSLVAAWREDPEALPWTGGGSFDQLVMTDLALSAGISPKETTYIPSDGGGEAIQALLNGTAQATAGGFADMYPQIEAGRLRGLGVVAPERLDGIDMPTLVELGYDVTLTNWRAMFAPPVVTDEEIAELEQLIAEAVATPEWKDAVKRYYWKEVPLGSEELVQYVADETERISALFEEIRG
ncbi:tripartite tricarboxylate transporter substrate binding protein [Brachybacterium sacelli]|uniref:Tricarboxylic transport membrane protein n=1 Tax=Brachybacterium sacelli TaxID=173364 RepID=A0ABS4X4I3_9MICO|nr:tripartite tricarboxylate transporter substrate-binding protein [Brachybacterium sacelli]MBP2383374.1 putative tricarboxylic transport membrane protein [Brachybacterium sacelli]